jgi:hypothetical protein
MCGSHLETKVGGIVLGYLEVVFHFYRWCLQKGR